MPFSSSSIRSLLGSYAVHKLSSQKSLISMSMMISEGRHCSFLKGPLHWIIRNTFYHHFIGGENIPELKATVQTLQERGINSIIDYAAENVFEAPRNGIPCFDLLAELNRTSIAFKNSTVSRMAIKLSAFFPISLLQEMSQYLTSENGFWELPESSIIERFPEYKKLNILFMSFLINSDPLPIMIDAEQLKIQPAIDFIAIKAMEKMNLRADRIMNTYQLYLKGSSDRLFSHFEHTKSMNLNFPVKLVRGAYLNTDKNISSGFQYGPIYDTAEETHCNYDDTVKKILNLYSSSAKHPNELPFMLAATHNRRSLEKAIDHKNFEVARQSGRVACAQLLGMQDGLSESMVSRGIQTFKYVPFGPLDLALPYLSRRAYENSEMIRGDEEIRVVRQELVSRFKTLLPQALRH